MILVIFKSRLRPGVEAAYGPVAEEMDRLAAAMPGLLSFKTYTAEDGERVTIQEWESEAHLKAWREHPEHPEHPEHRKAQIRGRHDFYEEYTIHIAEEQRRRDFRRDET